jgi:hypothetical protein
MITLKIPTCTKAAAKFGSKIEYSCNNSLFKYQKKIETVLDNIIESRNIVETSMPMGLR